MSGTDIAEYAHCSGAIELDRAALRCKRGPGAYRQEKQPMTLRAMKRQVKIAAAHDSTVVVVG